MTVIVHHLENSRSLRVLWLLEELAIPYSIRAYKRDPKSLSAPPTLRRVHPLGKAPIIEDGGLILVETGAIVEYLVDRADGKLGPAAHRDTILRYRHFLHYAEGSMMPLLFATLIVQRLGLLGRPARKPVQSRLDQHLDWLESELSQRLHFAGQDFTAVDVMMSFPLEMAVARGGLGPSRPNLIEWLDRMHKRPAYQAALAVGGPQSFT